MKMLSTFGAIIPQMMLDLDNSIREAAYLDKENLANKIRPLPVNLFLLL
jgi:hypothetical protein